MVITEEGCLKRDIVNIPTITLEGVNIMKGDPSDPNYRTHYLSLNFRVDPEGNLWISDLGAHRLLKYNSEGKYQDQIIFYPESTVISKESPKIDGGEIGCDLAPVSIEDFCFDQDENLYTFVRKEDLLSKNWKKELVVMRKDKTIHTYELDPDIFTLNTAVDSKKHIYTARKGVGTPLYPDSASILIIDSVGNKLGTMGLPLIKTDWNWNEISHFNYMWPAIDKEDNLWVSFLFQPIVRKYDSQHRLLWERKYLTAETKKPVASADSVHREAIRQGINRRKPQSMRLFLVLNSIQPLPDGKVLLFTCEEVAYELNDEGDICRKILLKRSNPSGGAFYSINSKGYIYEYSVSPVREKKINGIIIHKYKFLNQK